MANALKPTGQGIHTIGKNGEADKCAKMAKLVKW